jgi:hypothetical protein
MLRLWRRLIGPKLPPPPEATDQTRGFDVLVALGPADAIRPVKAAVQAINGVGWVSVENHSVGAQDTNAWLELLPALGNRLPRDDAALTAIRQRTEAVVETLGALPKSGPRPRAPMVESSLGDRPLPHIVLAPRPALLRPASLGLAAARRSASPMALICRRCCRLAPFRDRAPPRMPPC